MTETVEYTLNSKQLAEITLYMFGEYTKWCAQPKFAHLTFEQWLQQIINKDNNGNTSQN